MNRRDDDSRWHARDQHRNCRPPPPRLRTLHAKSAARASRTAQERTHETQFRPFGFDIHRRLGVYPAQREILFALEEMLKTSPQFRVADGFRIPFRVGSVMRASSLELVW